MDALSDCVIMHFVYSTQKTQAAFINALRQDDATRQNVKSITGR